MRDPVIPAPASQIWGLVRLGGKAGINLIPACAGMTVVMIFFSFPIFAGETSRPVWDSPKSVNDKTVFFGESDRAAAIREDTEPSTRDKSYPWIWLERGNNYLQAGRKEKAAAAFHNAYSAGGPSRVIAGFKLVETYEVLSRYDEALEILDDMKANHLVSNQEFGQARMTRSRLEDQRRKAAEKKRVADIPVFDGRAWLMFPQPERMRYVLDAMKELREHGVPLAQTAQQYAFHLDEYFIANPAEPASDGTDVLSRIVYGLDEKARVAIDRWRLDPASTVVTEPVTTGLPEFTGANWIILTHDEKRKYVVEAMNVLRAQNVPMNRTPYAYEYAIDDLFTNKPDLPAADSVVTLASFLYENEPEAREVLEALRLR